MYIAWACFRNGATKMNSKDIKQNKVLVQSLHGEKQILGFPFDSDAFDLFYQRKLTNEKKHLTFGRCLETPGLYCTLNGSRHKTQD